MAPRVFIIADDLTGACDSAAAFAMRGLRTRIALTPDAMAAALADPAQQVISVVTGTREGTRRHAEAAMAAIAAILGDAPGLVFKKIDSRMKGHIAAELAVLHAARPLPVLACPAIPRLGRLVRGGGVTGAGVSRALPVRAALDWMPISPRQAAMRILTMRCPANWTGDFTSAPPAWPRRWPGVLCRTRRRP